MTDLVPTSITLPTFQVLSNHVLVVTVFNYPEEGISITTQSPTGQFWALEGVTGGTYSRPPVLLSHVFPFYYVHVLLKTQNFIYFYFLNSFLKILFIYFLERGEGERKRGRETSMCGCLSCTPLRDLACNSGIFPDLESNWWPFGLQASTQSTEPHQPGQHTKF